MQTTNLSNQQQHQIAELLTNFSTPTQQTILARFDIATRGKIQTRMLDLPITPLATNDSSLSQFAEFLYFEPQTTPETATTDPAAGQATFSQRQEVRQPQINRNMRPGQETKLNFEEILRLDDSALDTLLKAAPPELTIAVLSCSPGDFVERVLGRLSPSESSYVRNLVAKSAEVNLAELQDIHDRYCAFAARMIDRGQLVQAPMLERTAI